MFSKMKSKLGTQGQAHARPHANRNPDQAKKSNAPHGDDTVERLNKLSKSVFIGTFIAIAAVGFAIVSVVNANQQISSVTGNMRNIVVTTQAIKAGASIPQSSLKVIEVPATYVSEGALTSLDNVSGKSACVNIPANSQVTNSELLDAENDTSLATKLAPDKLALTVNVSSGSGLSTLIRCGDKVNVNLTDGHGNITGVIRNIKVLGLDGSITNSNAGSAYTTVTLQVSDEEADLIIATEEAGSIVLTLLPLAEG